jgi:hypothetical protein
MTGRTPKARIPAAQTWVEDPGEQPAPNRRDWVFTTLWEVLVAMGAAFVPLPVEFDDDPQDSGWSEAR